MAHMVPMWVYVVPMWSHVVPMWFPCSTKYSIHYHSSSDLLKQWPKCDRPRALSAKHRPIAMPLSPD